MLLIALRRTCVALLFVALIAAVPVAAAAAPADRGDVGVFDAWWGQLSDLIGQLTAVFGGSSSQDEPKNPPPTDSGYGMGVDPDGRLPTSDPDEPTSLQAFGDPQCGSLLDPNGC